MQSARSLPRPAPAAVAGARWGAVRPRPARRGARGRAELEGRGVPPGPRDAHHEGLVTHPRRVAPPPLQRQPERLGPRLFEGVEEDD